MQSEEKSSFIVERVKNIKKLQQNVQDIMSRIFEIGTVASANPELYSSFMAMLYKQFSQLYIYSTNVSQQCKLRQSLCHYMVVQHWQLIEKLRVLEQLNQDKQNRLQANQQGFKQNNERIKQLENVIVQQQLIINAHDQVVKKEEDEQEEIKSDLFETKQLLLNYRKNLQVVGRIWPEIPILIQFSRQHFIDFLLQLMTKEYQIFYQLKNAHNFITRQNYNKDDFHYKPMIKQLMK
ncbi:hypothetical protein pb186bvf_020644 [Paramecium bursaria]